MLKDVLCRSVLGGGRRGEVPEEFTPLQRYHSTPFAVGAEPLPRCLCLLLKA